MALTKKPVTGMKDILPAVRECERCGSLIEKIDEMIERKRKLFEG